MLSSLAHRSVYLTVRLRQCDKHPWKKSNMLSRLDCNHEIKRRLLLGRKVMTNLDSIFKSRDITLLTNVHLVKAMVSPVVMYGCESWTMKKAERRRIEAFELWCWSRVLRVPWTARRSNQSILKEISPGVSLEGMKLKLKLHYWLDRRESEWTPGVGDGQGGLVCCHSWGHLVFDVCLFGIILVTDSVSLAVISLFSFYIFIMFWWIFVDLGMC